MNEQLLNLKFVEEVEKHPILYNYKLPEYSRKDLTEKAWSDVGKVANLTVTECKERWKNLRAVFVRNIKTRNETGTKRKKPYYLAKAMHFTLPFIRAVTTGDNSPEVLKDEQDQDDATDLNEDEEERQTQLRRRSLSIPADQQEELSQDVQPPQQWESEYRAKKNSARKKKRAFNEVDECFIEYFNAKKVNLGSAPSDKGNPRKMFLLSLLPELDEMTGHQMKIFKRKVLHLIDDIMRAGPSSVDDGLEGNPEIGDSYFEAVKNDIDDIPSTTGSCIEGIKQDIEDPPEFKVFDNPEEHVTIID